MAAPLSDRELELLNAYIDGELPPNDLAAFEERLAQDAFLRSEVEAFQATKAIMNMAERVIVPRNFTLDPAVYGRSQRNIGLIDWLGSLAWPALGFAGSLAAVMLVFGFIITLGQSNPNFGGAAAPAYNMEPAAESAEDFGDTAAQAPAELELEEPAPEEEMMEQEMAMEEEMEEEEPAEEEAEAPLAEPGEVFDEAGSGGGGNGGADDAEESDFEPFEEFEEEMAEEEEASEEELAEGESSSAPTAAGEAADSGMADSQAMPAEESLSTEEPPSDGAVEEADANNPVEAEALRATIEEDQLTAVAEGEIVEEVPLPPDVSDEDNAPSPPPSPPRSGAPIVGILLIISGLLLGGIVVAAIGARARAS